MVEYVSKPRRLIKGDNLNSKVILRLLIIFNLIFLIAYHLYLHGQLLRIIANNPDPIDKVYYRTIFNNFELSLIILTILIITLYLTKTKISYWLSRIQPTETKKYFYILLCVAVLLQLLLVVFIRTVPISDSEQYIKLGKRLYDTGSYSNAKGQLTNFWPVGLPAFISLFYIFFNNILIPLRIFNILLFAIFSIVVFQLLSKELSTKALLITITAFLFLPNNLFSPNVILTDYPFTILVWIVIWLLIKHPDMKYNYVLIGFLLALAAYTRPIGLLIPFILIIFLFRFYKIKVAVSRSVQILAIFTILLSPWVVRNYTVSHKFIPMSSNGGYNFLMGNNKNSFGNINGKFVYPQSSNDANASIAAYRKGIYDIANNPLRSIIRIPLKIFFAFNRGDSSITWSLKKISNNLPELFTSIVFIFANYIFYCLILISLVSFVFITSKDRNSKLLFIMKSLYVYIIVLVIIFVGAERYIIPLYPIHFYYFGRYFA